MTTTEFIVLFGPQSLFGLLALGVWLYCTFVPVPSAPPPARRRSRYTRYAARLASHAGAAE